MVIHFMHEVHSGERAEWFARLVMVTFRQALGCITRSVMATKAIQLDAHKCIFIVSDAGKIGGRWALLCDPGHGKAACDRDHFW